MLSHIQSDFYTRDYCIITLFLNCGMRLAELVTINMGDFRDDTIRITGKGNKERLVYLNNACLDALQRYRKDRASLPNLVDKGCTVYLQPHRQAAFGAPGRADRSPLPAKCRFERPRIFPA